MFTLEVWIGWTIISAAGSLLAAVVACLYTYYTYHLLQNNRLAIDRSNRLYEFQFYKEMAERLNTPDARKLTNLCQENKLTIDYSINANDLEGNTVSANFLNRILLNELESVAVFWKSGLINLAPVNTGFGFKILTIGNCPTIVQHVLKSRMSYPHTFSEFEHLYNEIYKIATTDEKAGYRERFID